MQQIISTKEDRIGRDERVVVLHGLASHYLWMQPFCWRLRRQGFRVTNWSYRSLLKNLDVHAERLWQTLTIELANEPCIHILGHSMGAIIVRTALAKGNIPNLGRVVFLAPPNHGSPWARMVEPVAGWLFPPVSELSTRPDSFVNSLPRRVPAEFGVIAAKYDVLVPVANTHLHGEQDHRVLFATHSSLLMSAAATDLAGKFFATGKF